MVRKWIPIDSDGLDIVMQGMTLELCRTSISRGAGTDIMLTENELWPTDDAIKITLSKDEVFDVNGTTVITRDVMLKVHQHKPTIRSAIIDYPSLQGLQKVGQKLSEIGLDKYSIFTDGSYTDTSANIDKLFCTNTSNKSSCSVVIVSVADTWQTDPMLLIEITDSPECKIKNSFTPELIAAAVACKIAKLSNGATDRIVTIASRFSNSPNTTKSLQI